jgi:hypothetical protein
MNLWIDTAKDSLVRTIGGVDLVFMNDAELRMLTGEPMLLRAARAVQALGPRSSWRSRASTGRPCSPPAASSPARRTPRDGERPDGRGRLLRGRLPRLPRRRGSDAGADEVELRRAMTYGSVLASFNVEEFGTERVRRLTREEIDARFEEFRQMTTFSAAEA